MLGGGAYGDLVRTAAFVTAADTQSLKVAHRCRIGVGKVLGVDRQLREHLGQEIGAVWALGGYCTQLANGYAEVLGNLSHVLRAALSERVVQAGRGAVPVDPIGNGIEDEVHSRIVVLTGLTLGHRSLLGRLR